MTNAQHLARTGAPSPLAPLPPHDNAELREAFNRWQHAYQAARRARKVNSDHRALTRQAIMKDEQEGYAAVAAGNAIADPGHHLREVQEEIRRSSLMAGPLRDAANELRRTVLALANRIRWDERAKALEATELARADFHARLDELQPIAEQVYESDHAFRAWTTWPEAPLGAPERVNFSDLYTIGDPPRPEALSSPTGMVHISRAEHYLTTKWRRTVTSAELEALIDAGRLIGEQKGGLSETRTDGSDRRVSDTAVGHKGWWVEIDQVINLDDPKMARKSSEAA